MENNQANSGRNGRTYLARPNSQARIKTGKIVFPCSTDHEQNWQPYTRLFHALLKVLTIHTFSQYVGSAASHQSHFSLTALFTPILLQYDSGIRLLDYYNSYLSNVFHFFCCHHRRLRVAISTPSAVATAVVAAFFFRISHEDLYQLPVPCFHARLLSQERLGEEILAPPPCQAFEPFTEVLDAVSGELLPAGSYPFPQSDDAFDAYPPSPPPLSSFRSGSGQAGEGTRDTVAGEDVDEEETKPMLYSTDGVPAEGVEESKGKEKNEEEDPDVAPAASPGTAAAAASNPPASSFASALSPKPPPARRQFRPKKKASSRTARVEGVAQDACNIKQEHESSGHEVSKGDRNRAGDSMLLPPKSVMTTTSATSSALGTKSSGDEVPTTEGDDLAGEQGSTTSATAAGFSFDGQRVGPDGAGRVEAALAVEEGVVLVREARKDNFAVGGGGGMGANDDSNGGNEGGFPRGSSEAGADKCSKGNGASYGLAAAKEEPREGSSISPGEGAPPAAAATATVADGAGAEGVAGAGGARGKAKEEPVM